MATETVNETAAENQIFYVAHAPVIPCGKEFRTIGVRCNNARQGMTVTPLQSVKAKPNLDTVKALESLLALAISGEVTGMAFACSLKNMRYVTDTVGFCYEHPTFARGMVAFLSDKLAGLVHSRNDDEIR